MANPFNKTIDERTIKRGKTSMLIGLADEDAQFEDRQRLIYLTKSKSDDGCTEECSPFQFV